MTASARSPRQTVLPFRLNIDPMERLLVANFKGDPEFEGLEPQVFDDPINGRGMRVLRYRKDGKVDVYWQPSVMVDRSTLAVELDVTEHWKPSGLPLSMELFTRMVRMFRTWPATYRRLSDNSKLQ